MKKRGFSKVAISLTCLMFLLLIGNASAQGHTTVRWDIVTVGPSAVSAGGTATPTAEDGSTITITGSGTFELKPGNGHVTGGGNWTTSSASGTYKVTGVAHFETAPGTLTGLQDNIGNVNQTAAGNAVLTIDFSDGTQGILTITCGLTGTPPINSEGFSIIKGSVDYWKISGVALFHITPP